MDLCGFSMFTRLEIKLSTIEFGKEGFVILSFSDFMSGWYSVEELPTKRIS